MNLLDIVTLECIKAPLDATDKKGVIDELVDVLAAAGKVNDPETLKDAVWSREQARTTGIGHGLAIPHGKSDAVNELAMAIGRPAEPIDFAAIDSRPVRLIVLLASPTSRTSEHIQALARISKLMMQEEFRDRIYNADSATDVYEALQEREVASSS
jgi:fructose-specific phosphotransferase system IIA component